MEMELQKEIIYQFFYKWSKDFHKLVNTNIAYKW